MATREQQPATVSFLSDYGLQDPFVGVCHGVIKTIDVRIPVIDVTHGIPRQNIRSGALRLADSVPYTPVGIALAIVDPEVGHDRRGVAVATADGRIYVGPDNGLLSRAIVQSGGATAAVDLATSPFRLEPVACTFHGRDVFAPVAAHLAIGAELTEAGTAIGPDSLASIDMPGPYEEGDALVVHVVEIDSYGNVRFDAPGAALNRAHRETPASMIVEIGGSRSAVAVGHTFADVGAQQPVLLEDANGSLALAVNLGDAAKRFGLRLDMSVRLIDL